MVIFLIGYMASGKTTLGRAFAREMGFNFIDLDFYITQRFRRSIPEIFATEGEAGFREIERKMLREVGEFCDTVVSCGGGTPCFFDNMEYMNAMGTTVLLEATPARIRERLLTAHQQRPIVANKSPEELLQFIESHLSERLPYYNQAHLRLNSDNLESRPAIAAAIARLATLLHLPPTSPRSDAASKPHK